MLLSERIGLAAILVAIGAVVISAPARTSQTPGAHSAIQAWTSLPSPLRQPITRPSAAAQVAWLSVGSGGEQPDLVAVDPSGRLVARLGQSAAPGMAAAYDVWRSADGSMVFTVGPAQLVAYSALDGKLQRTYSRAPGSLVGDAFSPDGGWLALLLLDTDLQVQLIDLRTGSSQLRSIGRDPNAKLPGMVCPGSSGASCAGSIVWGMAAFAPDSAHFYTLTDWGGPLRLTAFTLQSGTLARTAAAVDGQQGRRFPSCAGPAAAAKVVAGGDTLVAFCHFDGAVWFFDLRTLTGSGVVQSHQENPFWLSPIFTPDGRLLYLHQWPGFGDTMQVVDLTNRRLAGPISTPTNLKDRGPFAWLITNANAGGVASSMPISPDGLRLYSATDDGVMVLRVPDLRLVAKLAPGFRAGEVWISGDGQTIYATAEDGKRVVVMRADGRDLRSVALHSPADGFVASEHG
jgi:WD40 repeat protein